MVCDRRAADRSQFRVVRPAGRQNERKGGRYWSHQRPCTGGFRARAKSLGTPRPDVVSAILRPMRHRAAPSAVGSNPLLDICRDCQPAAKLQNAARIAREQFDGTADNLTAIEFSEPVEFLVDVEGDEEHLRTKRFAADLAELPQ